MDQFKKMNEDENSNGPPSPLKEFPSHHIGVRGGQRAGLERYTNMTEVDNSIGAEATEEESSKLPWENQGWLLGRSGI